MFEKGDKCLQPSVVEQANLLVRISEHSGKRGVQRLFVRRSCVGDQACGVVPCCIGFAYPE